MARGHEWDWETAFCIRCGMSMEQTFDLKRGCIRDDRNVVAVSHVIARQRMDEMVKPFLHAFLGAPPPGRA
jgi:hypothetical protein